MATATITPAPTQTTQKNTNLYKNPYGTTDPTTGAFTPGMAYTPIANPYTSGNISDPYGAAYQETIAPTVKAQYLASETSPQAVETARKSRSALAGQGIMSGSAYDKAQTANLAALSYQEAADIASQEAAAKQSSLGFQSNLAMQGAAFAGTEAENQQQFGQNLFLKATEYGQTEPTNELNAIKTSYPDISTAPLETQQRFSQLYSQITGDVSSTGQEKLPGVSRPASSQAAINAGFSKYADPDTAYATYTANPTAAAKQGIVPGGSDTAEGWTPTVKGAGFQGTVSGVYGMTNEPAKIVGSRMPSPQQGIMSGKLIIQISDGTTYEIDTDQFSPYV